MKGKEYDMEKIWYHFLGQIVFQGHYMLLFWSLHTSNFAHFIVTLFVYRWPQARSASKS